MRERECVPPSKKASKAELKRWYERCQLNKQNPKTLLKLALKNLLAPSSKTTDDYTALMKGYETAASPYKTAVGVDQTATIVNLRKL